MLKLCRRQKHRVIISPLLVKKSNHESETSVYCRRYNFNIPIRAFMFAHFRYYLTHANAHLSFDFNLMFQLHQILSMLSARDVCQFSMGNKRTLGICYDNKLWAQLYYQQCEVPNTMLYIMDHPGPLRVRATSG